MYDFETILLNVLGVRMTSISGSLFEDADFPAVDKSIFFSRSLPKPFVWKRPHVSYSCSGRLSNSDHHTLTWVRGGGK